MAYKIDTPTCIACGTCAAVCPAMAIDPADGKYKIDPNKCIDCGTCAAMCPVAAIAKDNK